MSRPSRLSPPIPNPTLPASLLAKFRVSLAACALTTMAGAVELNPLFQDNAVLQCDTRVPVWGTARDGEKIAVSFAGQRVETVASGGVWKVWLAPMQPDATPRTLTVSGDNTREITNVLVGEVWIASGQSNMERHLGLQPGQQPLRDWEKEAAAADHPEIRMFHVPNTRAFAPRRDVGGSWAVCTPKSVIDFSAVGYFFARDLHAARKVPVGIIHSSWGGTPAEAWTSAEGLKNFAEFAGDVAEVKRFAVDPALELRKREAVQDAWFSKVDTGSKPDASWSAVGVAVDDWATMNLPTYVESAGLPGFDGIVWFRREFTLPENWDGGDAELHLGAVDDMDTTWINGQRVGSTNDWTKTRVYRVPGAFLKRGANTLAVRVFDASGGGGLYGGVEEMRLAFQTGANADSVSLAGAWRYRTTVTMAECGWPPANFNENATIPTVLYNGMIHPLLPYAMRGVIWYQGENNVGRERQYRSLFPAMIADWRRVWGRGEFPFLFVQIAPYRDLTPEIREAQLLSWQRTKNTAMVVTADCGDADDIHPTHKQPVGARLALAARALAYGEQIDFSGPVFDSMEVEGDTAVLRFTHLGGGLVAQDGELRDFVIAGPDKVFRPAQASIAGDTIRVSAAGVSRPVAVRYGWAKVPAGNLFNRAGLPASPFRTDIE